MSNCEYITQIHDLKNKLDEKTEQAEDFYRWWSEEQQENNRLAEENKKLKEKNEELENQLLELSQAKTAPVMLTDSNAKGVL